MPRGSSLLSVERGNDTNLSPKNNAIIAHIFFPVKSLKPLFGKIFRKLKIFFNFCLMIS